MGYLDNSTITVDAILTKKGRELLARGRNEFQITQFALADDEIDYAIKVLQKTKLEKKKERNESKKPVQEHMRNCC